MQPSPGVSIIVDCYNGEQYLRLAIDSALAQDHPAVEVIVVDDGSSDGSAALIESFGDRVRPILRQENGGQVAAINQALALANQEIVIILDGDDLLMPHAASTLANAWRPGTVKLQFRLVMIDEAGQELGYVWPSYPPGLDTAALRRQLLGEGDCISVPACGNAYARSFLEARGSRSELRWMDQMLEIDAPLAGEVLSLNQPLAFYRCHDQSDSMNTAVGKDRFQKLLDRFDDQLDYLALRCRELALPFDLSGIRTTSLWRLELQLTLRRLGAGPGESRLGLAARALRAVARASKPVSRKLALAAWLGALMVTPHRFLRPILVYRYLPQTRARHHRLLPSLKRLLRPRSSPALP